MALTEKRELRLIDIREGGQFEIQERITIMDGEEEIDTRLHRCVKQKDNLTSLPLWIQEIGTGLTDVKTPPQTGKRYDKIITKIRFIVPTREMAITEKTRIFDNGELISETKKAPVLVPFGGDHTALDARTNGVIDKVHLPEVVAYHQAMENGDEAAIEAARIAMVAKLAAEDAR